MCGSSGEGLSGRLPHLIENLRGERSLILRQESAVVLGDHLRRILNGVARPLI